MLRNRWEWQEKGKDTPRFAFVASSNCHGKMLSKK
jgi:hypothetical protein